MSVLLAIIATERDAGLLERHWKYFKNTDYEILGVGTEDGKTRWPEKIPRLDTGKIGIRQTPAGPSIWGLCDQELEVLAYCLNHPKYESVQVVEADNLFVRKPPTQHPGGAYLITELPNRSPHGLFKTKTYFSTPRWANRDIAWKLYAHGNKMYRNGDVEHFISDRFFALICYQHNIPFRATPNWSPSVNVNTEEKWVHEARNAIIHGAWCLHAVKTQRQLDALKDLLP